MNKINRTRQPGVYLGPQLVRPAIQDLVLTTGIFDFSEVELRKLQPELMDAGIAKCVHFLRRRLRNRTGSATLSVFRADIRFIPMLAFATGEESLQNQHTWYGVTVSPGLMTDPQWIFMACERMLLTIRLPIKGGGEREIRFMQRKASERVTATDGVKEWASIVCQDPAAIFATTRENGNYITIPPRVKSVK